MDKTKKYRMERDIKGIIPGGMEHKQPVVGMLQRGGKVIGKVLAKAHGKTIKPLLKRTIGPGATLITDGFGGYHGLETHPQLFDRLIFRGLNPKTGKC